jgi:hypothetical protein
MQPDYILACKTERGIFKGGGFCFPWFLHSDHHAIVRVVWKGRGGRLRQYRRMRQKFLLTLPLGPNNADTITFDALAAMCVKPKPKQAPGKEWISKGTWRMIAKQTFLLQSGQTWQDAATRMQHKIGAGIKADK